MFRLLLLIGLICGVLYLIDLFSNQMGRFGPARLSRQPSIMRKRTLPLGSEGLVYFYAVEEEKGVVIIHRKLVDTFSLNPVCVVDFDTGVWTPREFDHMDDARDWAVEKGLMGGRLPRGAKYRSTRNDRRDD